MNYGTYNIACNFRTVASIMNNCDFFIGNEGGLAHLWATTKKKGIVIFGHWIPPYLTGYSFHQNLSINGHDHCGSLYPCDICISFFNKLNPEYVAYILDKNI